MVLITGNGAHVVSYRTARIHLPHVRLNRQKVMTSALNTWAGVALAIAGIAVYPWVWFRAEQVGVGLAAGVVVGGVTIPAMAAFIAGLGLVVAGLCIAFRTKSRGHRES